MSTKRIKSNNHKTFVLFQVFILKIHGLLVTSKGFPSLKPFFIEIHLYYNSEGIRIKQISTLFIQCGSSHRGREGEGFLFS